MSNHELSKGREYFFIVTIYKSKMVVISTMDFLKKDIPTYMYISINISACEYIYITKRTNGERRNEEKSDARRGRAERWMGVVGNVDAGEGWSETLVG